MIEQKEGRIEVYSRTEAGWSFVTVEPPDDDVVLDAIGARLSLEAVYENSGRSTALTRNRAQALAEESTPVC